MAIPCGIDSATQSLAVVTRNLCLAAVVGLLAACAAATAPAPGTTSVAFDFRQGPQGWTCTAAFYLTTNPYDRYEIVTDYRPLLGELASQGSGWFLTGVGNAGLLPFCTKRIEGLVANRLYAVDLTVEIATNTRPGCGGTGGPPNEDPVIAGMGRQEPKPFVEGSLVRVNLDFGTNGSGGEVVVMGNIGTVAVAPPCSGGLDKPWELKTLTRLGVPLRASPAGDGWLVAGFELNVHKLAIYLTKFSADFR